MNREDAEQLLNNLNQATRAFRASQLGHDETKAKALVTKEIDRDGLNTLLAEHKKAGVFVHPEHLAVIQSAELALEDLHKMLFGLPVRLPLFIEQTPASQLQVVDLTQCVWGYDANEETLFVATKTDPELDDIYNATQYNVGFPYTNFGFEDHIGPGSLEVLAEELISITEEEAEALRDEERERYDSDREALQGQTCIILLNPDNMKFHREQ